MIIGVSSVAATIAAALIQRSWQIRRRRLPRYEQIEFGSVHESESFSALDVVKVLGLERSGSRGESGTAVYTDSYLVRRESETGNGVVFRYATSGTLVGECVSHGEDYVTGLYDSDHFSKSLAICVHLGQVAQGSVARVTNKVVYTGAFDRADGEDFETHVERPTRSLTIILTFARERACRSVSGMRQLSERGALEITRQDGPVIASDGRLVYWHITPKKGEWLPIGAKYRLKWTWRQDPAARLPVATDGGRSD